MFSKLSRNNEFEFEFEFHLKDPKILDKIVRKHGNDLQALDKRSLTICSNTDYINITYHHVICPDAATAKVSALLKCLHSKSTLFL